MKAAWEVIRMESRKSGTSVTSKIDLDVLNEFFI